MSENRSSSSRSIFLIDRDDLLDRDFSTNRRSAVNGTVTLTGIEDSSGKTVWEARAVSGKLLPVFQLKIEPLLASGPVVIPDGPGSVYVCYEDENVQQSWCIRVRTD